MSLQGELFPLISGMTFRAQLNQALVKFSEVEPELPKDAIWRLCGEAALLLQVLDRFSAKARTTPEHRQRQVAKLLDPAAVLTARFSAFQERPPASTSQTLSLVSSSTGKRNKQPTPGGRSYRPKWRRSSMASKPA